MTTVAYKVLVFHGQHLSPSQRVEAARAFGGSADHVRFYPKVIAVQPTAA